MYSFQIYQIVVININTDTKVKTSIAPINNLEVSELQKHNMYSVNVKVELKIRFFNLITFFKYEI